MNRVREAEEVYPCGPSSTATAEWHNKFSSRAEIVLELLRKVRNVSRVGSQIFKRFQSFISLDRWSISSSVGTFVGMLLNNR